MPDAYGSFPEPNTVRFERVLPGPIERVWDFITLGDKRGTWLAAGEMELREGGAVELIFDHRNITDDRPPAKYKDHGAEMRTQGRITRIDPPRLIAFTWPEQNAPEFEVTFELTPRGEDVQLVLTHRRLATRDAQLSVSGGWHAHLDILAALLAGRKPPPFWAAHTRLEADYATRVPAS